MCRNANHPYGSRKHRSREAAEIKAHDARTLAVVFALAIAAAVATLVYGVPQW